MVREPAITLTIIDAPLAGALDALVRMGIYGPTPEEVVLYLVRRSIDDLTRAGVIMLKPK